MQPTLYIMKEDAKTLPELSISQKMPDNEFK